MRLIWKGNIKDNGECSLNSFVGEQLELEYRWRRRGKNDTLQNRWKRVVKCDLAFATNEYKLPSHVAPLLELANSVHVQILPPWSCTTRKAPARPNKSSINVNAYSGIVSDAG